MKFLKNILTVFFVIALVSFFVIISYSFWGQENWHHVSHNAIEIYKAYITKNELGTSSVQNKKHLTNDPILLEKWQVWYFKFWKLTSAFVLPNESTSLSVSDFSLSGKEIVLNPKNFMIFSLYDPFAQYSLVSRDNDFRIVEVTNGSFYVGTEADGTRSLYSIDAVIRLEFMVSWKIMTDMVLFPWMYIRFDPKMNAWLEWANLFRILQSLEVDGTKDATIDATWIEFINPRMNSTDGTDSFFMYKLPIVTHSLFQTLHVLFYNQVSQIDLDREYGSSLGTSVNSIDNPWLLNPGKKSHFLLLQLDNVLSSALRDTVSLEQFRTQISQINQWAQTLAVGNDVEARLEDFLTDWRFALFGWSKVNPQFAEIYQAVSEEVWRAPVTAHARLLQKLSDIYSKNLVAQKKDLAFSKIDTFTPTSLELERTLDSSEIQQRDYFDIALYAFNVLKKTEDKWLLESEAVFAHSTYSLIQTILISTDRYIRSIDDLERKNTTFQWIALHFYEHILSVISHSIYATFMEQENWRLYLKSTFRPTITEPKIHIDESLIRDIQNIDGRLVSIWEKIDALTTSNTQNSPYVSIKKSIALFHGFARILDYDSYNEYIKSPYIQDKNINTTLPLYTDWTLSTSSGSVENQWNSKNNTLTAIDTIIWLLWDIPRQDIVAMWDGYRIAQTQFQFLHPTTWKKEEMYASLDLNANITRFSNLSITYSGKTIIVMTDKTDTTWLLKILWQLPRYIARLDSILESTPTLGGDIRFLENTEKIIIGVYPFSLVP